jgi:glutathione synthase/RimK-type ligase-like ATP-grasp enzyme
MERLMERLIGKRKPLLAIRGVINEVHMLNILIATRPDDADSVYVKFALDKLGHNTKLWYTADMPSMQSHTFRLDNSEMKWSARGKDFVVNEGDSFDVVWVRRPAKARLDDLVHPDDLKNATNENRTLHNAFWETIAPNAFWINDARSRERVSCKLTQLKVAAKLGFNVPESIISNDPERIIRFISSYEPGQVIYKPIYPVMWVTKESLHLTYTKPIMLDDLPSPETLKLTPGIYQKRIKKAYELRVTCMGHTAIATKIYSQDHKSGVEDWRCVSSRELKMEPYALPDEIANRCFALMMKFGVVFGCFDFIVTPNGEYIFLEINEQGQFLWQEEYNSQIKLLDPFCQFMISRNPSFKWISTDAEICLPKFRESVTGFQALANRVHVDPGLPI